MEKRSPGGEPLRPGTYDPAIFIPALDASAE
jgi:hypothetical protein